MQKTIHKAGFQIAVRSSENDSDYHNTKSITVENIAIVRAIVDILNGPAAILANQHIALFGEDDENQMLQQQYNQQAQQIIDRHYDDLTRDFTASVGFPTIDDLVQYIRDDAVGDLGLYCEDYMLREIESITVTYSPHDVVVQVVDVNNWS